MSGRKVLVTREMAEKIVDLYDNKHVTAQAIAVRMGLSATTVNRVLVGDMVDGVKRATIRPKKEGA